MLKNRKKAFTLAETLITLTIVGVLAAIIIPIVSQNINDKAFTESKDVFNKKLVEAMSQMRTLDKMSGYANNQEFLDEFKNYMKTVRTCDKSHLTDCFASTIYADDGTEITTADTLKTGKDFGKSTYTSDLVGALFANGTSALIAYDPACVQQSPFETADATSCLSILYDVNGFKKPNKAGRDIKMYHVDQLGTSCAATVNGACVGSIVDPAPLTIAECESRKAELGINHCCAASDCVDGNDYWAGAVAACGHVNNLPTIADFNAFAEEVFPGGNWVTAQDYQNGTFDSSVYWDDTSTTGFFASDQASQASYAAIGYFYPLTNRYIRYTNTRAKRLSGHKVVCKQ